MGCQLGGPLGNLSGAGGHGVCHLEDPLDTGGWGATLETTGVPAFFGGWVLLWKSAGC